MASRSEPDRRMVSISNPDFRLLHVARLEQEIKTLLNIANEPQKGSETSSTPSQGTEAAKWTIRILRFLGQFNRKDLLASESSRNERNRILVLRGRSRLARLTQGVHLYRLDRSEWFQRWVLPLWWPRVVQLVWSLCFVHLSVSLVLMYQHDRYKFRLHRVRWLNESHAEQFYLQGLETEQSLNEAIARSGHRLQVFWSADMHVSYSTQCFLLSFMILSTICRPLASFYYAYMRPLHFDHLVELLDHSRATRNCLEAIKQQARLFVKSSRTFTGALMEFSEKSIGCPMVAAAGDNANHQRRPLAAAIDDSLGGAGRAAAPFSIRKRRPDQAAGKPTAHKPFSSTQLSSGRPLVLCSQTLAERQLRLMLLGNHLMPMNHSAEWLESSRLLFLRATFMALVWYILTGAASHDVLLQMHNSPKPNDSTKNPTDTQSQQNEFWLWRRAKLSYLLLVELSLVLAITGLSTLFHSLNIVMSCVDQIRLARRLLALIRALVQLNTLRFSGHLKSALTQVRADRDANERVRRYSRPVSIADREKSSPSSATSKFEAGGQVERLADQLEPSAQLKDQMNNDLLLVVMHYRIFLARQLDLIQHLGVLALWIVALIFMLPLLGRCHQPYLMGQSTMRPLLGAYLLCMLLPGDLCLLFICYMHRRCLDLYLALNSIVAHATETASRPEGRNIYDRHQISMLRKELSHHEGVASRLATKFAGISMTYANFVRIHLYLGFLVLSLMSEDRSSEEELTVSIFSDPFKLF